MVVGAHGGGRDGGGGDGRSVRQANNLVRVRVCVEAKAAAAAAAAAAVERVIRRVVAGKL